MSDRVIRPMRTEDEDAVRALYARCHPTFPSRPNGWYGLHPTLVAEIDGQIAGSTSCSVGLAPVCRHVFSAGEILYGHGVYVRPDQRGRGLGGALAQARMDLGRAIGIRTFLGMTQPDNAPMVRIFRHLECAAYDTQPDAYPDGADGVVYIGDL